MPIEQLNKPIIFLAFSNDLVDKAAYLRGLKKEREGILSALEVAEEAGLCQVISEPSTSIKNIIDTFQKYGDRIAVFHYGGHANGFQLLLETDEGGNQSAHSSGLISFLAKQNALKLIFLNGCSSKEQAQGLVDAGIEAVIGTSSSINDDIATKLSIRFYRGLARGISLDKAWNEATDEIKTEKGTANVRDLVWDIEEDSSVSSAEEKAFPWSLYYRDGVDTVAGWNLPEASNNPLFGLPPIPDTEHLPPIPFPGRKPYTREHAELFFGRNNYIKQLYELVTGINTPPIILLHGLSNIGKSSLVMAGLMPRLEAAWNTLSIRGRGHFSLKYEIGRSLEDLLYELDDNAGAYLGPQDSEDAFAADQQLIEKLQGLQDEFPAFCDSFTGFIYNVKHAQEIQQRKDSLSSEAKLWHQIERHSEKSILLVIDELQQLYNHEEAKVDDPKHLVACLSDIFGDKTLSPEGKVILVIREEYLSDLQKELRGAKLPFSSVELRRMPKEEMLEVITGIGSTEKLSANYQLTIAPNLPVVIADDILEEEHSPASFTLQAILHKLWNEALKEEGSPHFSGEAYRKFIDSHTLMDDFYEVAMKALQQDKKINLYLEYGFVLELLSLFTINQRQSFTKSIDDVLFYYIGSGQEGVDLEEWKQHFSTLLDRLTAISVMIKVGKDKYRLLNNALAITVSRKTRTSQMLVQRINRMLAYKTAEHEQNPSILLNKQEVAMIEKLQEENVGMRAFTIAEKQLFEVSQEYLEATIDENSMTGASLKWREESINNNIQMLLGEFGKQILMHPVWGGSLMAMIPKEWHKAMTPFDRWTAFLSMLGHCIKPLHIGLEEEAYLAHIEAIEKYGQTKRIASIVEGKTDDIALERNMNIQSPSSLTFEESYRCMDADYRDSIAIDLGTMIKSLSYGDDAYLLVSTIDGKVSVWVTAYGTKYLEIGSPDPHAKNHYLNAAIHPHYDLNEAINFKPQALILQTRNGVKVYFLYTEETKAYYDCNLIPDRINNEMKASIQKIERQMPSKE